MEFPKSSNTLFPLLFRLRSSCAKPDTKSKSAHVGMGASNSYVFFSDVLPRAIKKYGGIDTESLRKAALDTNIPAGGTLLGYGVKFPKAGENDMIGQNMLAAPVVMQYIDKKVYVKKKFNHDYELLSLIGNVTLVDEMPFIHTHISFSDTDFKVYGGHLFDAEVIAAAEFCIFSSNYHLHRKLNCDIGLSLWNI